MHRAVAIIPARLGSTRFPRKALADRTGRALVLHVADAAARAGSVARVVVATDGQEILAAAQRSGVEAVLTGEHPNGTSRLNEAAQRLNLPDDAVIVNVQGDEPEIDPAIIDAAVHALGAHDMATVASPIPAGSAEFHDPNVVKVVLRTDGGALYFSRAPIPLDRDGDAPASARPLRHVGLYVYRRAFLRLYASLAPTPLEQAEKLEQLRALEHGRTIAVAVRESSHAGIDTPEQYEAFVRRWAVREASAPRSQL